jgi:4-amino-4-deoxy-L-arabinose transferase-like glycosyltransferase
MITAHRVWVLDDDSRVQIACHIGNADEGVSVDMASDWQLPGRMQYSTILAKLFAFLSESRPASIAGIMALVTLLGVTNTYYFGHSRSPTFWDDSSYLVGSLDLYDAITERGISGFATAFAHLYGNKAPLICIFPVPVYLIIGRGHDPRCLVGIGFLILMSIYIFRLGGYLWSPREGLLAAVIVQTMPLFYGLSRQFLVDYGLATFVLMWIYYLLRAKNLASPRTSLLLGILLGIGVLMKITFPLYVIAPSVVVIWARLRASRDWRQLIKVLRAIGCIVLIAGVVASPWYLPNLKTVLGFAFSAGFGRLSVDYGSTDVFSWHVVSEYLLVVIVAALSCYYAVLLIALIPLWAALARRGRAKIDSRTLALLLWIIVPFTVTTFAVNKDVRFTAPVLAPVALFLAHTISTIFGRWRRYSLVAAGLVLVPALAYGVASLPAMKGLGELKIGRWVLWSPHLAWYASTPSSEGDWGQEEIGMVLCRDAHLGRARLFIPLAHQYLNNVNLQYLVTRLGCGVQVFGLPPQLRTWKEVADFVDGLKPLYVIVVPEVPEPQLAPQSVNFMKAEAEGMVARRGSGFHLMYRASLGATGTDIEIYRRD